MHKIRKRLMGFKVFNLKKWWKIQIGYLAIPQYEGIRIPGSFQYPIGYWQ